MATRVDRLYVHCGELITLAGASDQARRGAAMNELGVVVDGAVAVDAGRIVACGATAEVTSRFAAAKELDLSGFVVMPGLVVARSDELVRRGPVRAVRDSALTRLRRGSTTQDVRIDGADGEVPRELLAVARSNGALLHRTLHCGNELVAGSDAASRLARAQADVDAIELDLDGVDRDRAAIWLDAARGLGLRRRVVADRHDAAGSTEFALDRGVDVVFGLGGVSVAAVERLAATSATMPVLPVEIAHGRSPARALLDAGCALAIAPEHGQSVAFAIACARRMHGLGLAEAVVAATMNAAVALGYGDQVGSLHPGKRADLLAFEASDHGELFDAIDGEPPTLVVVAGEPVGVTKHDLDPEL